MCAGLPEEAFCGTFNTINSVLCVLPDVFMCVLLSVEGCFALGPPRRRRRRGGGSARRQMKIGGGDGVSAAVAAS